MMMKKILMYLTIVIIAVACIAGCATTPPSITPTPTPTITSTPTPPTPTTSPPATTTPGEATVKTASGDQLGTYLTDADGLALYYFALDVPGSGTTACNTSTCLSLWTLYNPGSISVSPSLNLSDFGTISVSGGEQVTYRGWPLYLYNGDMAAGDTTGDGFREVWYVMKPDYSVVIMENSVTGAYLADGTGRALYNFSIDSADVSACTNSSAVLVQGKTCIQLWPVFLAPSTVVPSALAADDFSMVIRSDGLMQTSYRGMPLYYFQADTTPGQTLGRGLNGFGGTWNLVSPNATPFPPATTTVPPTTTSAGGYGY
jgi:predicted lipoprotein with Yx(FWY)xxD motif